MNILKNIFGRMTASDEWKARLYEAAEETAPHERKKRPAVKRTAAALVSAAAALAVSVTTAAVAGFFDLGTVMRNRFDDAVSAEKLTDGEYQPLDVSAENDLMSVKALAFIGDYEDCYVILEVRSKQHNDDLKNLFLGVMNYNELCEDTDGLGCTSYMGEPVVDDNGEQSYIFKVKCFPAYTEPSAEKQAKLFLT